MFRRHFYKFDPRNRSGWSDSDKCRRQARMGDVCWRADLEDYRIDTGLAQEETDEMLSKSSREGLMSCRTRRRLIGTGVGLMLLSRIARRKAQAAEPGAAGRLPCRRKARGAS